MITGNRRGAKEVCYQPTVLRLPHAHARAARRRPPAAAPRGTRAGRLDEHTLAHGGPRPTCVKPHRDRATLAVGGVRCGHTYSCIATVSSSRALPLALTDLRYRKALVEDPPSFQCNLTPGDTKILTCCGLTLKKPSYLWIFRCESTEVLCVAEPCRGLNRPAR